MCKNLNISVKEELDLIVADMNTTFLYLDDCWEIVKVSTETPLHNVIFDLECNDSLKRNLRSILKSLKQQMRDEYLDKELDEYLEQRINHFAQFGE